MSYLLVMDVDGGDSEHAIAWGIASADGRLVRVATSRSPHQVGVWNARLAAAARAGVLRAPVEFIPVQEGHAERLASSYLEHCVTVWDESPGLPGPLDYGLYATARRVMSGEMTFPEPERILPQRSRQPWGARGEPVYPVATLPGGYPGCDDAIPKIIHMAWLGARPLTDLNQRCIQSWFQAHPDWRIKFWCDEDSQPNLRGLTPSLIREAPVTGGLYRAAPNYGEATDILRLELLRAYGGVWVDCDMECLRPIDDIAVRGAFVGAGGHARVMQLENAVMGACPHHPWIEMMLWGLPFWAGLCPASDTIYRTGPVYVHYATEMFAGGPVALPADGEPVVRNTVSIHPASYWYQHSGIEEARESGAYGYHHWTGSWYRAAP